MLATAKRHCRNGTYLKKAPRSFENIDRHSFSYQSASREASREAEAVQKRSSVGCTRYKGKGRVLVSTSLSVNELATGSRNRGFRAH